MQKVMLQEVRTRRRESKLLKRLAVIFVVVLFFSVATVFSIRFIKNKFYSENSIYSLYDLWSENDILQVYSVAKKNLEINPFQSTALTFLGYSAFKLAVAEAENLMDAQAYIDEALSHLRIAIRTAFPSVQAQTYYVLGLSYFYKDKLASYHYYADLVIKYLTLAQEAGYKSDDISELLGLCYADLGETEKSIQSFTEALLVRETDTLLYNIAKEYYLDSQGSVAKQYLQRALAMTNDDEIKINCYNILGKIYTDEEKYSQAREVYESILKLNENFADAYYGLGIIYEKEGNNAKARAELRKCLKFQVNHAGAIQKLAEIK